ncbi:MAG: hypothetical protein JKY65_17605 [Planctomycetes bacterium]|nr:hypothetical protein [Planctomycetota bacterium]
MNVTFRPPALGSSFVPIKITGEGTLELRDDGLYATGAAVSGSGRALAVFLGTLAFGLVAAGLQTVLGLDSAWSGGIGAALAVGFVIPMLRRPAKEGAPVTQLFPWKNVKRVSWDGTSECLIVVIQGMKPKGGLYVLQPKDSPLEQELKAKL